jgi:hypothetical protein
MIKNANVEKHLFRQKYGVILFPLRVSLNLNPLLNMSHEIVIYLISSLSLLHVLLSELRSLSREMNCKMRINGKSGKSKIDRKLK